MTATRAPVTSIETYCGHYLDYLDPQPEQIELADIARGLAQTCRFAGQTTRYYSVAEHAVYVESLVGEVLVGGLRRDNAAWSLAALHHDSHEAYLTDWPSPLKHAFGPERFDEFCDDIDAAIASKFGFPRTLFTAKPIKDADAVALRHEAATLKFSHGTGPHWNNNDYFAPLAGIGWTPDEAERRFLERHEELSRLLRG